MHSSRRNHLIALLVLVIAGVVRMPIEQSLSSEFRQQKMLAKPIDIGITKRLGQGFWAVSLGGLRTMVTSILNIRAYTFFEEARWIEVADIYDSIVMLAPNSAFYWDHGSWHMAYNAASHYERNYEGLPPLRARSEKDYWIDRGTKFLEEGTHQNPENGTLWFQLGRLYSDANKKPDYTKAAEAFRKASENGKDDAYVKRFEALSMARSDRYADQALEEVNELFKNPKNRVPMLLCLRFVLVHRENPLADKDALAHELFGDDMTAYRILGTYYSNMYRDYPMSGVAEYLRVLETKLGIPEKERILKEQDPTNSK